MSDESIIIVEDNPEKSFDIGKEHKHFSWKEIQEELGDDAWIISKRDSAIRSFGFYMAHKMGAEYIFTLDDDCYPDQNVNISEFVEDHTDALCFSHDRWTELVPGQRSRGIPYRRRGTLKSCLNVGLWSDVPDLDSIQTLSDQTMDINKRCEEHRLIPNGQYFPMCGMNMAFERKVTPLMFFPLMGEGYPYRRFDDIWCGIIMKKVVDHLRWHVSCGNPIVRHSRASDPFVNLVKEAPGIAENEHFWETIDKITLESYNPVSCMKQIGQELQGESDKYTQKCGKAIETWAGLFE